MTIIRFCVMTLSIMARFCLGVLRAARDSPGRRVIMLNAVSTYRRRRWLQGWRLEGAALWACFKPRGLPTSRDSVLPAVLELLLIG